MLKLEELRALRKFKKAFRLTVKKNERFWRFLLASKRERLIEAKTN